MRWMVAALAVLAGCSGDDAGVPPNASVAKPRPAATALPDRSPTGRWTGVEGMYLVVSPGAAPDRYRLEMQYDLDHRGVFEGRRTAGGIAFMRDGGLRVLRPADGDATGLKYLANKTDCLVVQRGEGYCRN